MKAMVIGIPPEYKYPGKLNEWRKNNTYYAANLGASLITNAIMRQFSADYVDDFSDISSLKNKYDVCFLAFATHIHPTRNVSLYADVVEQLDIKTIVISAGIKDYEESVSMDYKLHPSINRILHKAAESSQWIGVRGHYTASVLHSNGFKNVVPIGCPSLYWTLDGKVKIEKPESFSKPLIVYHRTIALNCYETIRSYPLLGQDYQDQPLFTNTLRDDTDLKAYLDKSYNVNGEQRRDEIYKMISGNGIFRDKLKEWFDFIGEHDFIIGNRLHGTIAALVQHIPAILVIRDLRTKEIAEFYKMVSITFDDLNRYSIEDIYRQMDFSMFNEVYSFRYKNYVRILDENELKHNLAQPENIGGYAFTFADLNDSLNISYSHLSKMKSEIEQIKQALNDVPALPDMLTGFAQILAALGKHREAAEQFAKVVQMSPNNWAARLRLVDEYLAAGQPDRATAELTHLKQVFPQAPEVLQREETLSRILYPPAPLQERPLKLVEKPVVNKISENQRASQTLEAILNADDLLAFLHENEQLLDTALFSLIHHNADAAQMDGNFELSEGLDDLADYIDQVIKDRQ